MSTPGAAHPSPGGGRGQPGRRRLIEAGGDLPISKTDIAVLITKITNEMPLDRDVDRVRRHLESGGWPLTGHGL